MTFRYYSLETPKHHMMQSHTCTAMLNIMCVTCNFHSTTLWLYTRKTTISRTQLCRCRPRMNVNSCTKVKTIHMKAKWFQRRMLSWHRDK